MVIQLPDKVTTIINTLQGAGFEAYAVGGCVRDSLLGRDPKDWDITTSAKPEQVKSLFSKTIDTGIQHGTVTIMLGKEGFEVTTYRVDGIYEDARHPKEVAFTVNLAEDLKRRDFTINAMAYNEQEGLIDIFQGKEDLHNKIIRCVGNPIHRFTEDALRMMRAVRFAAQLGFSIDAKTLNAIRPLSENLSKISGERIQIELVKLLVSDNPKTFQTVYETGMSRVFLPEFDALMNTPQNNPHHCYNVGEHTLTAIDNIGKDKVLRLTMLLHDIAKPLCKTIDEEGIYHFYGHPQKGAWMAQQILRRLKFDNDTIYKVTALIQWHDDNPPISKKSVRFAVYRIGLQQYPALFEVKRADNLAKSSYQRKEKMAYVDQYEQCYEEIMEQQECLSLRELAVTGKDLIALGMKPGKKIGETLTWLLEYVLEYPQNNIKERLIEQVKIHEKI
ncbi:MAG: CCA tRNA nucleotidyltransferase [Lachnospiraceae bacterium]